MKIKKNLGRIALAGVLTFSLAKCDGPRIEEVKDFTGDGKEDILLHVAAVGGERGTYLFINKGEGVYDRAKKYSTGELRFSTGEALYFKTDNGETYFWDGEYYKLSPKSD